MNDEEKKQKISTDIELVKLIPFRELKKKVGDIISEKDSQSDLKSESKDSNSDNKMTNERISRFLDSHSSVSELVKRRQGHWTFRFADIATYIMTDARKGIDRMRIMSLITENPKSFSQISPERLLRANCHEALDVRFCYEHDGSLWSAFIHRLSTLAEEDLESGLQQVTALVRGFPFKLSSTDFYFRGKQPEF